MFIVIEGLDVFMFYFYVGWEEGVGVELRNEFDVYDDKEIEV